MAHYVGLDVSLEETSICVVDENGQKVWQGKTSSQPAAIAQEVGRHAPALAKVGFETGPLSTWHWHELQGLGPAGGVPGCPPRESGAFHAGE